MAFALSTRSPLVRYTRWLHTQWPAGRVEALPVVNEDFSTNVEGLYVAGDLAGVPLLKFAIDSGTRAVRSLSASLKSAPKGEPGVIDLVIVGGGVAGISAGLEAKKLGLDFVIVEAKAPLATLEDMPAGKPIYTYPTRFLPQGALSVTASTKETLLQELDAQLETAALPFTSGHVSRITRASAAFSVELAEGKSLKARRVLIAVGRSGGGRKLGVPGEQAPHVHHRLIDPSAHAGKRAVVVGGGDNAVESAIALARAGASVTLVHRGRDLTRPKPANLDAVAALSGSGAGKIDKKLSAKVVELRQGEAVVEVDGKPEQLSTDEVFVLIGRDAPLDLFRTAGVELLGEVRGARLFTLAAFVAFCVALYDWKSGGVLYRLSAEHQWWPFTLAPASEATGLAKVLRISASQPSFWYTLAYSLIVFVFGVRRIRRRRTPYIAVQTWALIAIQVIPLFVLPEILLPLLDQHGLLPASLADSLFPRVGYGHGREFWRAYGFILAWPLMVWNVFTSQPLTGWLVISFVQTCVLIPLAIRFFGKGAYCGFICSCGALAETLGDAHRHKMPHGPLWNRLNFAGQALLVLALVMLGLRITGWVIPGDDFADRLFAPLLKGWSVGVDVALAGVIGVGLYFWFSGRVWCRFFCPLAALMNIYTRFSKFRIFAEKQRCISCNACTTVCHQGIDVMAFAVRGAPMEDPQCVRCGACVNACPTAVLSFGRFGPDGQPILDTIEASPVRLREGGGA